MVAKVRLCAMAADAAEHLAEPLNLARPCPVSDPGRSGIPHLFVHRVHHPVVHRAHRPGTPSAYTVISGDTLAGISARFCGTASDFPSLAAASGVANPDVIYPGQPITLDCHAAPAAAPA